MPYTNPRWLIWLALTVLAYVLPDFDFSAIGEDAAAWVAVSGFHWGGIGHSRHETELHFQQGRRLHDNGQLAEAERVFRETLAVDPEHAESMHRLGVIAMQTGKMDSALASFDQAIRRKRLNAIFHVHRAHALLALRRSADALDAARQALRLKPQMAEGSFVLGHALSDLNRAAEAVAAYRDALRRDPRLPDLRNALALALWEANRPTEAIATLREAARHDPTDTATKQNLVGMLKDSGLLTEAEALARDILRRRPDDAVTHFNLALTLFLAERFDDAWPEWAWRFRADPLIAMPFADREWGGEPPDGRILLVHAEQGMGDAIQFCRYLDRIPAGTEVVLQVHRPLVRLLSNHPNVAQTIALDDAVPHYDLRVPIMSLPLALGATGPADAAMTAPYITADGTQTAKWRALLPDRQALRVGLVWAGNPERARMDRRRSVPLALLGPLLDVPGVSFISLQKGAAAADLALVPFGGKIYDASEVLDDFADTAALIAELDLVIAADTAVAHLAGAMGKPIWLLNRADTCWRWGLGRTDSVWYPALRQFRQETAGNWSSAIAQAAKALPAFAAGGTA